MSTQTVTGRPPRVLTGRMVLLYLVTFFGVIFSVNFYMIRAAVSTFSGVETESSYKAGLTFKKDVAASQAQDALHWKVDANLQHGETGAIIVTALDAQDRPLSGITAEALLEHPTDKRLDVAITFVETTAGQFRSLAPLPSGRWDLVLDLKRADEVVFRSKSRISL